MYDEYDEEVAAAEAAEEAAIAGRTLEDKDAEIKPFLPKCALVLSPALMHACPSCMHAQCVDGNWQPSSLHRGVDARLLRAGLQSLLWRM